MVYFSEGCRQENPELKTVCRFGQTCMTSVLLAEGQVRKFVSKLSGRKDKGGNAYMAAKIFGKL